VKLDKKQRQRSTVTVKNENGELLSNPEDVLEIWMIYIAEIYDKD